MSRAGRCGWLMSSAVADALSRSSSETGTLTNWGTMMPASAVL